MIKKFTIFTIIIIQLLLIVLLFSCEFSKDDNSNDGDTIDVPAKGVTIKIEYTEGRVWARAQIYCIWLESNTDNTILPILVSERLITPYGATGSALSYWRVNKKSLMNTNDIDAVTTATPNRTASDPNNVSGVQIATPIPETASDLGRGSFSVTAAIPDGLRKFTVYFELEHSSDANHYFGDQPSVVYSADINLDKFPSKGVKFIFAGWCSNSVLSANGKTFAAHELHTEEEYIANVDSGQYPATDMMKNGAKVTVVQ